MEVIILLIVNPSLVYSLIPLFRIEVGRGGGGRKAGKIKVSH